MADPILDEAAELELWKEFKKTHSKELRDILIRKYMNLVKSVAGKIVPTMNGNVDYDDLVSCGQFGLIDAINKFDPTKGVKFITYAVQRIRGAIFDELRSIDWIPRSVRSLQKELEVKIDELEVEVGRAVSDAEIAKALNITVEEFHQRLMRIQGTAVLSLDDEWSGPDTGGSSTIRDTVESSPSQNPDALAEREEIRNLILKSIRELPEKEQKVLIAYYHEDLTFKEIGTALGVSESRISQLHTKANLRLRAKLTNGRKGIF
jgi:RNA polymerase sigma factor for flagellar operon FliA